MLLIALLFHAFARLFFGQQIHTIKRRNLKLSMRYSTVYVCCIYIFLDSLSRQLFIAHLNKWTTMSPKWMLYTYNQIKSDKPRPFQSIITKIYNRKIPFLNINYCCQYNRQNSSKQILYYMISALLFHSIAFSMFYTTFIFGHFFFSFLYRHRHHCRYCRWFGFALREYFMGKFIKSLGILSCKYVH